jgi:Zn-dependent protease with chaperone function
VAALVMHVLSRWLLARFSRRFGFTRLTDPAAIPLFLLLYNFVFIVLSPVGLALSRHNEHEADRFGLELTRDNRSAATSFVKLQEENLSNPWPAAWFTILRSTHPSVGARIEFFNTYRPWESGEPLKYEDKFD